MITPFSDEIVFLNEVDSTNNYLKQKASESSLKQGFTVVSKSQTQGKGQGDKQWLSEPGENLLFSLLLFPSQDYTPVHLNMAIAMAVWQLVKDLVPKHAVQIKWPNDVLVEGEKIAGILIENQWRGRELLKTIVGIGLNVNQVQFQQLHRPATSIRQLSGGQYQIAELAKLMKDSIYNMLALPNSELLENYHSNLYLRNVYGAYLLNGKMIQLKAIEVNTQGLLVTHTSAGEKKVFTQGEIKFLE